LATAIVDNYEYEYELGPSAGYAKTVTAKILHFLFKYDSDMPFTRHVPMHAIMRTGRQSPDVHWCFSDNTRAIHAERRRLRHHCNTPA